MVHEDPQIELIYTICTILVANETIGVFLWMILDQEDRKFWKFFNQQDLLTQSMLLQAWPLGAWKFYRAGMISTVTFLQLFAVVFAVAGFILQIYFLKSP